MCWLMIRCRFVGAGVGRDGGTGKGSAWFGRIFGTGVNFKGGRGGNGTARRGTLATADFGTIGVGRPEGSEILGKISFNDE